MIFYIKNNLLEKNIMKDKIKCYICTKNHIGGVMVSVVENEFWPQSDHTKNEQSCICICCSMILIFDFVITFLIGICFDSDLRRNSVYLMTKSLSMNKNRKGVFIKFLL